MNWGIRQRRISRVHHRFRVRFAYRRPITMKA